MNSKNEYSHLKANYYGWILLKSEKVLKATHISGCNYFNLTLTGNCSKN